MDTVTFLGRLPYYEHKKIYAISSLITDSRLDFFQGYGIIII